MDFVYVLGGLVLLGVGGESVVRAAVTLAERLGLSPLFIGLVIVALGTSTPEMAVSISAVIDGKTGIAIGNIVGSNIANILLVLGLGAMICPIPASKQIVFRDSVVVLLSATLFVWLGSIGEIDQSMGVLFVALLLVYFAVAYFSERVRLTPAGERALDSCEKTRIHFPSVFLDFGLIVVGLVAIVVGANFLIDGAVNVARTFGVSEAAIGLSLVAIGTSLPELVVVVIAALKRHPEVAVGGIIGSNIFNILAVLGLTAIIQPIHIDPVIAAIHLPILMVTTIIIVPFLITNWRISRIEGLVLVIAYVAYLWLLLTGRTF